MPLLHWVLRTNMQTELQSQEVELDNLKGLPRSKGAGIGLRSLHYQYIITQKPKVNWFEVISDNYLGAGLPLYHLDTIRKDYPINLHGVGMSLGSTDPLNKAYLNRLKKLAARIEPDWVSEHLSWISVNGHYLNDLIPLIYTEEVMDNVASRILQVQDFLGRQILIENPSPYLTFTDSTMTEWEFVERLVKKADCYLLLDINNVYVNAINNGFDPLTYLDGIPGSRVKEIHLAGYQERENYLLDTHGYPVHPPVWELYQAALARFGAIPTLIEWDTDIPSFEVLMAEANKAEGFLEKVR